jgi:hypothetical protein
MSEIHAVGAHLSAKAKAEVSELADAFGRSAFNRYYYAAYLSVRDLLRQIEPRWKAKHSKVPDLLETDVINLIRKEAERQLKRSLLSLSEKSRLTSRAATAASALANLLRTAYAVRVISDYEPEQLIVFSRGTFSLLNRTEGEARAWLASVSLHKGILLQVAKELALVS